MMTSSSLTELTDDGARNLYTILATVDWKEKKSSSHKGLAVPHLVFNIFASDSIPNCPCKDSLEFCP